MALTVQTRPFHRLYYFEATNSASETTTIIQPGFTPKGAVAIGTSASADVYVSNLDADDVTFTHAAGEDIYGVIWGVD